MKEFMVGCNYWASHAGTEMWRNWDEKAVREDLEVLAKNGVEYLRVFPNWRDFQPVWPLYDGREFIREYRVHEDKLPENKYFIDETMMQRFRLFCDIAEEYNMKLIVGILTGFMSGRTFIPPALYGKNLFTDPVALRFEMKFIEGFVQGLKHKKAIFAWNPGNECNNLSKTEDYNVAEAWLGIICNAIKANDPSRMVISGMHGLSLEGTWRIDAQAAYTDMLTTHPYPYFVAHCTKDNFSQMRTLLHATCETKYYADISEKPCLVEEIGNLGNMMCDEETAAGFLKVNMFSNWAHGSKGVIWWCANDQMMLETPPYCWNMCEVELGLLGEGRREKPLIREMKKFSEFVKNVDFELPKAHEDGICLVTDGQDQWGAAYMTTLLAKMAKVNLKYAYAANGIPDAEVYLLPSVASLRMMPSYIYKELKRKISEGATLYLSVNNPIISEFEDLTGLRIKDSRTCYDSGSFEFNGKKMTYTKGRQFLLEETRANVLCRDEKQNPIVTECEYGKGKVYFVNFPMETRLLDIPDAHKTDYHEIYRMIFKEKISSHIADSNVKCIGITEHYESEKNAYIVLVNYSGDDVETNLRLKDGYVIEKQIYGNAKSIAPYDAAVLKVSKNKE